MEKDFLLQKPIDARKYSNHLASRIENGSFSKTTFVTRISSYRKMEEFLRDTYGEDICERCWNKIQMPALDSSVSKIPSVEDIDELLELARSEGQMWYVAISLVFKCALTASELVELRRKNLIREHDDLFIYIAENKRTTHFQETRYVKVPDDMKKILSDYLSTIPIDSEVLFFNKAKRPISIKNIDDALKRMYADSNKRYTIKDIRARGILEMLSSSNDPSKVGEYVGLSTLRMRSFIEAAGLIGDKSTVADYNNVVIKPFKEDDNHE